MKRGGSGLPAGLRNFWKTIKCFNTNSGTIYLIKNLYKITLILCVCVMCMHGDLINDGTVNK